MARGSSSPPEEKRLLYRASRFSGSLSLKEHRVECELVAEIAHDSRLVTIFDPLPITDQSRFLSDVFNIGQKYSYYTLDATNGRDT